MKIKNLEPIAKHFNQVKYILSFVLLDETVTKTIFIDLDNPFIERFHVLIRKCHYEYMNGKDGYEGYDHIDDFDFFDNNEDVTGIDFEWVIGRSTDVIAQLDNYNFTYFDENGAEYECEITLEL